ncbi:MAG: SDR family oxidoreductase [Solirubrobacteraceae bacterium]|nr:SDR family oxidoreductase [Solirubrobacteraceae bacterium]
MDVVIVGAHGKIALALARLLVDRGDKASGVIRNPDHSGELEAMGVTPVIVDLEDEYAENDLAHAFRGADAIVFAAGAGPGSTAERKLTVDYGGAVHSAAAAARAEVKRFVIISSIGTDDPPQDDDIFSVYLRAKANADQHVRGSGLDHTIVRPVTLTDDEPTGRVRASRHVDGGKISRDDVAAVVLAVLDNDASIGRTFEVAAGEARVQDAVAGLADQPATLV